MNREWWQCELSLELDRIDMSTEIFIRYSNRRANVIATTRESSRFGGSFFLSSFSLRNQELWRYVTSSEYDTMLLTRSFLIYQHFMAGCRARVENKSESDFIRWSARCIQKWEQLPWNWRNMQIKLNRNCSLNLSSQFYQLNRRSNT